MSETKTRVEIFFGDGIGAVQDAVNEFIGSLPAGSVVRDVKLSESNVVTEPYDEQRVVWSVTVLVLYEVP